jgi:hypothetical protein
MPEQNAKNRVRYLLLSAAAVAFAVMFFLPVKVTLLDIPRDDNMAPYGEITATRPMETCMDNELDLSSYGGEEAELLLADYNRVNSSDYMLEIYGLGNNKKDLYARINFGAREIEDNSYKSFNINARGVKPGKLCFGLKSSDARPGNAITVWMNGNSEPVLKISARTSLYDLISRLDSRNVFLPGKWGVLGLFFIYLVSIVFFAVYILTIRDGSKKTPKPPHNKRTHGRRI